MPQITETMKKKLWGLFAVVLIVVFVAWAIFNPGPEHIEDTNGPDDYSLQQITEEDVLAQEMGNRGGLSQSKTQWEFGNISISDGVQYSCRKFTGVYLLNTCTIFKGSDIHVYLSDFQISSGNFAFYVALDGKIVGEVKPDEYGCAELVIENIEESGTLEYIIAGESANFRFIAPSSW